MTAGDIATRAIAVLLFALFAVDRGTAWMLPLTLPCLAFLALRRRLGAAGRVTAPIVAALGIVVIARHPLARRHRRSRRAADRWNRPPGGAGGGVRTTIGRRRAGVVDARDRARGCWRLWLRTRRHAGVALPAALTVFLLACVVIRTATNAAWAASGPPMKFAEAQLWGRDSTPVAAKFIFLELEPGGSYPSWQTLSQRAAAEMQYTHQKVYLPDRSLLEIDKAVSANYGFDPATVDGQLYPFYAYDLQQKYLQFSEKDFSARGALVGFELCGAQEAAHARVSDRLRKRSVYDLPHAGSICGRRVDAADDRQRRNRADVERRRAPAPRLSRACRVPRRAGRDRGHRLLCHNWKFRRQPSLSPAGRREGNASWRWLDWSMRLPARRLPLEGDASGEHLAFWEYFVAD